VNGVSAAATVDEPTMLSGKKNQKARGGLKVETRKCSKLWGTKKKRKKDRKKTRDGYNIQTGTIP